MTRCQLPAAEDQAPGDGKHPSFAGMAREPPVSQGNADAPRLGLADAGLGAAPDATARDPQPGPAPAQGHPWGHVELSLSRLGEAPHPSWYPGGDVRPPVVLTGALQGLLRSNKW